jgi:Ca2+-binding EF-hand superfamily protein
MVAVEEWREAFEVYDEDKDGSLDSAASMGTVLWSLGLNPSMQEVEEMFTKAAKAGKVTVDDVIQAGSAFEGKMNHTKQEEELLQAFKAYEKEGYPGLVSTA